jgi:hypothetical protein
VNVERREVLSLLHDAKAAMVRPLVAGEIKREDALKWLDELREFRGQATPLPDTRLIDGMTAHGFALRIGGLDCTLWASDDGLPLAMTLNQGSLLDQRFQFTFDPPADPARFATDIPAGYHRLEGEAD